MWVTAYAVPLGFVAIIRSLTLINTSGSPLGWILGFNSGHQLLRESALGSSVAEYRDVWLIMEEGDQLQWQIDAGSLQTSVHGQLLTIV